MLLDLDDEKRDVKETNSSVSMKTGTSKDYTSFNESPSPQGQDSRHPIKHELLLKFEFVEYPNGARYPPKLMWSKWDHQEFKPKTKEKKYAELKESKTESVEEY